MLLAGGGGARNRSGGIAGQIGTRCAPQRGARDVRAGCTQRNRWQSGRAARSVAALPALRRWAAPALVRSRRQRSPALDLVRRRFRAGLFGDQVVDLRDFVVRSAEIDKVGGDLHSADDDGDDACGNEQRFHALEQASARLWRSVARFCIHEIGGAAWRARRPLLRGGLRGAPCRGNEIGFLLGPDAGAAGRAPPRAASDAAIRAAGLARSVGGPDPGSSGWSGGRSGSIGSCRAAGIAACGGGSAMAGCGLPSRRRRRRRHRRRRCRRNRGRRCGIDQPHRELADRLLEIEGLRSGRAARSAAAWATECGARCMPCSIIASRSTTSPSVP